MKTSRLREARSRFQEQVTNAYLALENVFCSYKAWFELRGGRK